MMAPNESYLSDILNKPVVDHHEETVGVIQDVAISPQETYPRVVGLLVKTGGSRNDQLILLSEVERIGRRDVLLKRVKKQIPFTDVRTGEVLLRRSVLDRQIVDLNGARVVRVNDLKLALVGAEMRLVAAEVGVRGILRRIGLEEFVEKGAGFLGLKLSEALIPWNYLEFLGSDVLPMKLNIPRSRISDLHPADIAKIISQAHAAQRSEIFESLSTEAAAESLHELTPMIQAYLINSIDLKKAVSTLDKMPPDEVADLLAELPEDKQQEFLRLLRPRKADKVKSLLAHPEETAGGLMTTEFMTIQGSWTAEETIVHLRSNAPDAETIYYLYVVDEQDHLTGVLTLRKLIVSAPETPVSHLMIRELQTVSPEMNVRQIADIFSKYNLLAVPVVDPQRKIMGIITVDDVMDYIRPPLTRRKRHMLG